MARARNKIEESKANEAAIITGDVDIDAIEAAMNGGNLDIEVDDAAFDQVNTDDLLDAIAADEKDEAEAVKAKDAVIIIPDEDNALDLSEVDQPTEDKPKRVKSTTGDAKYTDADVFASEVIARFGKEELILDIEQGALTEDTMRQALASITQKKVRAKALNMVSAVISSQKMDNYSKIALDALIAASAEGKAITRADIKKAYTDAGYKPGTVASQSGQMMVLLPALGLVNRSEVKDQLIANENSVLLNVLTAE